MMSLALSRTRSYIIFNRACQYQREVKTEPGPRGKPGKPSKPGHGGGPDKLSHGLKQRQLIEEVNRAVSDVNLDDP